MRFACAKFGFAVLASAFLAAGMSGVAFGAAHAGPSGAPPCSAACPSLTRLSITGPVTSFGSEQSVVFNVRVKAQARGTGTPTGSVTVGYRGLVLCTVVLSGTGTGTCSPAPAALPARTRSYPVNAVYSGDAVFTTSHSGARHVLVLP
jgi:hypothetical protein